MDPTGVSHERYTGNEKIIFGIDLGTTTSSVSYCHLYPGTAPQVRIVTRWPGQEEVSGDSKIPSVVAYKEARPIAYGAEALEYEGTEGIAIAKWFKLHLHPDSMKIVDESNAAPTFEIPALPTDVSIKQLYSDMLRYLFDHTKEFFKNNNVDGASIWSRLENEVVFCLAIPNGWDTAQQSFLREACISGGLLSKDHHESRLRFVTEGEASVHYALQYTQSVSWLRPGVMFAVVDAGGSTVDTTVYECKEVAPKLVLEEVQASECVQAGSVFVDRAAQTLLERKLRSSKFADESFILEMINEFERKTKRKFDGTQQSNIIKFGRDRDNDKDHGILKGRITLTQSEVEQTFSAAIPKIISSCSRLISKCNLQNILLVGGFGESPYLRWQLLKAFSDRGVRVATVGESSKKAAAEGSSIWYIKQFVTARAARSTFGIIMREIFDPDKPLHLQRKHKIFIDESDEKCIRGYFQPWITKNEVVSEISTKKFRYSKSYSNLEGRLGNFRVEIHAYDGDAIPYWGEDEDGNLVPDMRKVCTLKADLSGLQPHLEIRKSPAGKEYWYIDFSMLLFFGGTSLRARLAWKEGSKEVEGPVSIITNSVH